MHICTSSLRLSATLKYTEASPIRLGLFLYHKRIANPSGSSPYAGLSGGGLVSTRELLVNNFERVRKEIIFFIQKLC